MYQFVVISLEFLSIKLACFTKLNFYLLIIQWSNSYRSVRLKIFIDLLVYCVLVIPRTLYYQIFFGSNVRIYYWKVFIIKHFIHQYLILSIITACILQWCLLTLMTYKVTVWKPKFANRNFAENRKSFFGAYI